MLGIDMEISPTSHQVHTNHLSPIHAVAFIPTFTSTPHNLGAIYRGQLNTNLHVLGMWGKKSAQGLWEHWENGPTPESRQRQDWNQVLCGNNSTSWAYCAAPIFFQQTWIYHTLYNFCVTKYQNPIFFSHLKMSLTLRYHTKLQRKHSLQF